MEKTTCGPRDGRRAVVAAAAVLVALHLAKCALFVAVGQPPLEGDAMHYWNDAGTMAGGDWLMAHGFVEIIRTPGYPFFLALLQLAFGRYSLVAAVVCQQCMVFATAMVAAWMCARISGSRLGGLCGLVLGLFCISQNSVANRLLSDTLFGLLLTLTVAVFVAWCERPAATAAVAIGFLLGAATLVRPIAQFAWGPVLLAMACRWADDLPLRRLAIHGTCLLGVFAAVLAPWYVRNYSCCGQVFLSKTAGLTLWGSLFKSNSPLDPAVPFADGRKTRDVLSRLEGVELGSQWAVLKALEKQGLTRMEAIDRMREVCVEAIEAHPWKFIDSRLRRFAWFWITPNGTWRPLTRAFHMYENRTEEIPALGKTLETANYCGQAHWQWDGHYRDGKLNLLWHPNPWLYLLTGVLACCGIVALFVDRCHRPIAIAVGTLLPCFAALTAVGAPPEYRYRMILEPMFIVCIAQLANLLVRVYRRQPAIDQA